MNKKDREILEGLIGKYCLCAVIREIADTCIEKEAYKETNLDWIDQNLNGDILTLAHNDIDCPNHRK